MTLQKIIDEEIRLKARISELSATMTLRDVVDEEVRLKARVVELSAMTNAPPVMGPPRIVIDLSETEMVEFHQLVRRARTSVSALGQRAIKQLLGQIRSGAITLSALSPAEIAARMPQPQALKQSGPEMTAEEIEVELEVHGRRLIDLNLIPGRNRTNGKGPPRVVAGLTVTEFEAMRHLSRRTGLPISEWGARAVRQLLDQVRGGSLPMVIPSTADNAISVFAD